MIGTIAQKVAADLLKREALGIAKYGVELGAAKLSRREHLQHAYEEAMDLASYLKAEIEREEFQSPHSLSPRLAWIAANAIELRKSEAATWEAIGGDYLTAAMDFFANGVATKHFGFGESEDAAITDWARKNNVKLWNEA